MIGTRIRGKVIANKPGHYINTKFSKNEGNNKRFNENDIPQIDFSQKQSWIPVKLWKFTAQTAIFIY